MEYEKILTYDGKRLLMGDLNLIEVANMYPISAHEFFDLLDYYLTCGRVDFDPKSIINAYTTTKISKAELPFIERNEAGKVIRISSCVGGNIIRTESRELLVPVDHVNMMKEKLFNLAYIKCSNYGDEKFECYTMDSGDYHLLIDHLFRSQEYYSCIYRSAYGGHNEKMSRVPIDYRDREARLNLIMKKN